MASVHRTILVVDVERFGSLTRTDQDRVAIRAGLYRVLTTAMTPAHWADCDHVNCGDGVLVIIPPAVAKSVVVESLPDRLIAGLRAHNETHGPARRIRLRLALHAGEVTYDDHGVVGAAVNHAFRLLDAAVFKAAFARAAGPLGLIASTRFHDEVARHTSLAYQRIRVTAKETDTTAWMCLPGGPDSASPAVSPAPCELPPTSRHFIGRDDELARLHAVLAEHDAPTVVITAIAGTAGIGKTTLATRWANTVRNRFPDGQLHVDLRGFDSRAQLDPAQALHGFLEALGVAASAIPGDLGARSALYRSRDHHQQEPVGQPRGPRGRAPDRAGRPAARRRDACPDVPRGARPGGGRAGGGRAACRALRPAAARVEHRRGPGGEPAEPATGAAG
jgi:AAA ATPase domain